MPSDLEMQQANHTRDAQSKLLEAIFGLPWDRQSLWPGTEAYLAYLKDEFEAADIACFEPLWSIWGTSRLDTTESYISSINRVIDALDGDCQNSLSLDEVLQLSLTSYGINLRDMDPGALNKSRQGLFLIVSWLTTVFQCPKQSPDAKLCVRFPFTNHSLRAEQDIAMAKRPILRLIRGFGPLLPTTGQFADTIEQKRPELIHASSLNMSSLHLIDKIRIRWTSSLGCHLMFDPLSRTIALYRFPSFCATSLLKDSKRVAFDR